MLLFGSCVWVRPVCRRNMACFGCSVARLLGCSVARLLGGTGGTDGTGGAVARRIAVSGGAPVAVRRFCAVPGLNPLSGSAFRVHFPNPPFGPAFPGLLRACSGSASGPVSGSASGPVSGSAFGPVSGSAFGSAQELFPGLLSGLASGAVARIQVLFCLIAECGVWFRSGRRIRLCDFCRSRFRRRACNSLLPVFLGLRREPVI